MKGICFNAGGGLGDILRAMLTPDVGRPWCQPYWGQLGQWKTDHPDQKIKLVIASHNPAAIQLFELIPWIDEIVDIPWVNDGTVLPKQHAGTDLTPMRDHELCALCKDYEWKMPEIYMNKEEQDQFNKIIGQGPYVVLYPFGGYGARIKPEAYIPLIEKLRDRGMRTVIVGQTYTRNVTGDDKNIQENFEYVAEYVTNLVNKASIRLTANLAMSAGAYVGSLGCYMHAAFAKKIKSVCLTCYEIWEDNGIYGGQILRNESLWYLNENIGKRDPFVYLFCLNNEENLSGLWDQVAEKATSPPGWSRMEYWGDPAHKRKEVHI